MALGHRLPKELLAVIVAADLIPAPAHPFYHRLNGVLVEAGFDAFVEDLCRLYYADHIGRPSIPPGIYFRMLFVGYFEGLNSQRGIAWRCSDSRSLQAFLGYLPTERTPDHSRLTKVRQRLPDVVHEHLPSGLKQTLKTVFSCPRVSCLLPVFASHTHTPEGRMFREAPAAMRLPSGLKHTLLTLASYPLRECFCS